jgi:hypothetical protein
MTARPSRPLPPLALASCLFLIGFGAFFRVVRLDFFPALQNFAPIMAIACCGALLLPGWLALAAPLGALVISDVLLDLHYGASIFSLEVLPHYFCFAVGVASGLLVRRWKISPLPIFGLVAANSLLFYLITNFFAWLGDPAYPQTASGLLQALTIGLPGWPPTWTFLRNSLVSDLLFTGLFLAARHLASRNLRQEACLSHA